MVKKPTPPEKLPERLQHRAEKADRKLHNKPPIEKIWGRAHTGAANLADSATTFYYSRPTQVLGGLIHGMAMGLVAGFAIGMALATIPLLHGIPLLFTGGTVVNTAATVLTTVSLGTFLGGSAGAVQAYHYAEEHDAQKMGDRIGRKIARKGRIEASVPRREPEQELQQALDEEKTEPSRAAQEQDEETPHSFRHKIRAESRRESQPQQGMSS